MDIKREIQEMVISALGEIPEFEKIPPHLLGQDLIERPNKASEHGDFSSSIPLKIARHLKMNPIDIAEAVANNLPVTYPVSKIRIVPPGFINFFISEHWISNQIDIIRNLGTSFGFQESVQSTSVQIEFVSVNPTGPVHVGHARGAVVGSTLANIFKAVGYKVEKEYYLNDAGTQIDIFNISLLSRYRELFGEKEEMPENSYQGQYMIDLAKEIKTEHGKKFFDLDRNTAETEIGILGLSRMIEGIMEDMKSLGVVYDFWFSEKSLFENGQFETILNLLKEQGYLLKKDGATWFRSSMFGDDEDKVVIRRTGTPTYFATDMAYHYNKFYERNFDRVIDILGADHQGHVRFMKAFTQALKVDQNRIDLLIYQLVTLKRGNELVRASKRTGQFVTLRQLVEEVGKDACRYFFLSKSPGSQMEFDLNLAKEQSDENPVYYIQYAHARIAGILRLASEQGLKFNHGDVNLLNHSSELDLIRKMITFPEILDSIVQTLEPQQLPHYALELSQFFHTFYQQCRVVSNNVDEIEITLARLKLVDAVKITLSRCLILMGMSVPERM